MNTAEKLDRSNLWSLEDYEEQRDAFRAEVIAHKKPRRVALGEHVTLMFEDFLTMKYQVQEMLRTERIFTADGIAEEMDAYNPLIPDGQNWKATMLIEYADVEARRAALVKLKDVEHSIWAQVAGCERLTVIANEDMERSNDEKTAAVHFLRIELDANSVTALRDGAALSFGVDHPALNVDVQVTDATRESLLRDLA